MTTLMPDGVCKGNVNFQSVESVSNERYDVVVVGAGIVGCAMAFSLASRNSKVLLVERDWSEPNRIVGELMQPGGIEALRRLGMEDCLDEIDAVTVRGYAVLAPKLNGEVLLPYSDIEASKTEWTGGDMVGASFHHGRFVQKLRQKASSVAQCFTGTVKELKINADGRVNGVVISSKDSNSPTSVQANLVVVGDGCFSKFRAFSTATLIPKRPKVDSYFVGLMLRDCELPFPKHGHVVLAYPSPILLYQIGSRDTRILVDIPGQVPPSNVDNRLSDYLLNDILPQLPTAAIREAFADALRDPSEKPRVMPNGWLPTVRNARDGLLVLGDAHNMRHPLTGGGMTVALWDVYFFTREFAFPSTGIVPSNEYAGVLTRFYRRRKRQSSVVNILAQALYQLFAAADDVHLALLQRGCFETFRLGGTWKSTPMALLAGVLHSPTTLVVHFFKVAFCAVFTACRRSLYDLIEPLQRVSGAKNGELYPMSEVLFYTTLPLALLYMIPVAICHFTVTMIKAVVVIGPFIYHELAY